MTSTLDIREKEIMQAVDLGQQLLKRNKDLEKDFANRMEELKNQVFDAEHRFLELDSQNRALQEVPFPPYSSSFQTPPSKQIRSARPEISNKI